jgi:hypothetical protein
MSQNAKALANGDRSALQSLAQRAPFHPRHDVVQVPVGFAGVDQRNDMRMRECGRDTHLSQESLFPEGVGD